MGICLMTEVWVGEGRGVSYGLASAWKALTETTGSLNKKQTSKGAWRGKEQGDRALPGPSVPAPTVLPARVGFSSRLSWSVASRILYLLFLLGFPFCLKNTNLCLLRKVCEAYE